MKVAKEILNIIDDFLSNVQSFEDDVLLHNLVDVSKNLSIVMGIKKPLKLGWRKSNSIFIEATTDTEEGVILFNLCRKKVFERYKIDSYRDDFLKQIENFKSCYALNEHDEFDDAFMWTIENRAEYLNELGSYKDYKLSLIATLLHELRHNQQKIFSQKENKDSIAFGFIRLYNKFNKNNFNINHSPLELDAWRFSLSAIKQYLQDKKMEMTYVNNEISFLSNNLQENIDFIWQNFLQLKISKEYEKEYEKYLDSEIIIKAWIRECLTDLEQIKNCV